MLIFWDIDGTLMSCGSDGTEAMNRAFFELYGFEDAFLGAGVGGALDFTVMRRAAAEFGIGDFDPGAFETAYISNLKRILGRNAQKRALPGVVELLGYARGRGDWTNLLLTGNLRAGAEVKLRSVGLWDYFDESFPFGFGDAPGEKWDAALAAVEEARRRYGGAVSPGDAVVIGDSVYDIRSAKRIGARHIAVATGPAAAETLSAEAPGYLFGNLADTPRVLAAISGFD
jgi:phosphoglycolate phosphatase-like HAD superfamily hydrolase